MSNMRMRSLTAAVVAALLTGALVVGLYRATEVSAATTSNLPSEKTRGQVIYLSGDISKNQEGAIQRAVSQYPLELKFSQGGSVSAMKMTLENIPVTIKDDAGKVVLDARSHGPLMLAKLPDGRYTISAESAGRTETRTVDVERGKHETVVFNWAD
jgi:hypothetical protein